MKNTKNVRNTNKIIDIDNVENIKTMKRYQHVLIVSLILFLAILIYSNSIKNGFIYFDDPENIIENTSIHQISWTSIVQYFTTSVQFTYSPLVFLSFAIDYQVGKLDPSTYHLTSLLLHLFNIILVYWLFLALTGKWPLSLFITTAFAIHPVFVDGVTSLATRSNVLYTFFYLGALILYTYYLKTNYKLKYLLWSSFLFLLSVFAKPPAVVLPIVLFLWDYYYGRKWNRKLIVEKIPFFLIAIIIGLLAMHFRVDANTKLFDYTLFDRFIIICSSMTDYFYRLFAPFRLSFVYAYPAKAGSFLPWYLYLNTLILFLVIWGAYQLRRTKKVIIVGLAFFFINILLSQTVLLIDNYKANRYAYMAYIGLFFILGDFHVQVLNAVKGWRAKLKNIWKAALVIFIVIFSILTYSRNSMWKDTVTLLDDVIKKEPNIPWVFNSRGIAKFKANDYREALKDFNHALELDPNFVLSYYYRGALKEILSNDYNGAIIEYNTAISFDPQFAFAYYKRGMAKMELSDYQGALYDLSKTIELNSYFTGSYLGRGNVKYKLRNYSGAIADYDTAILYDPGYSEAYNSRGLAKMELADYPGALNDFSQAIAINQGYAEAYYNRGKVNYQLKDRSGARADLKKALELGFQPATQLIQEFSLE